MIAIKKNDKNLQNKLELDMADKTNKIAQARKDAAQAKLDAVRARQTPEKDRRRAAEKERERRAELIKTNVKNYHSCLWDLLDKGLLAQHRCLPHIIDDEEAEERHELNCIRIQLRKQLDEEKYQRIIKDLDDYEEHLINIAPRPARRPHIAEGKMKERGRNTTKEARVTVEFYAARSTTARTTSSTDKEGEEHGSSSSSHQGPIADKNKDEDEMRERDWSSAVIMEGPSSRKEGVTALDVFEEMKATEEEARTLARYAK